MASLQPRRGESELAFARGGEAREWRTLDAVWRETPDGEKDTIASLSCSFCFLQPYRANSSQARLGYFYRSARPTPVEVTDLYVQVPRNVYVSATLIKMDKRAKIESRI